MALAVAGPVLTIRGPVAADWPLARVTVRTRPDGGVVLSLRADPARLQVTDPATLAMLRQHVRRWPRAGLRWPTALGACVAAVALGAVLIDAAPGLLAPLVPRSWEASAGAGAERVLSAGHRVCEGQAGQAALDRLVIRLAGEPIRLVVLDDAMVNAFTLPGRRMIVMRGLIASGDGDELAAVIGHEIGHVINRDPARQLIRQVGLGVIGAALGWGDLGSLAGTAVGLSYGRDAESRADAAAIAALQAAGLRADGLARFFQRMERDDGRWVKFLSSHPATAERRQRAQQPDTGEPAFTAAEWDAVQAMCTR